VLCPPTITSPSVTRSCSSTWVPAGITSSSSGSERNAGTLQTACSAVLNPTAASDGRLTHTDRNSAEEAIHGVIGAAEWVLREYGTTDAFDEFVADGDPETVRQTLLDIDGVGPKTTDCVLLFSRGRGGVFPVYN